MKPYSFFQALLVLVGGFSCGGGSRPAAPPAPLTTPRFNLFGGVGHGDSVPILAQEAHLGDDPRTLWWQGDGR